MKLNAETTGLLCIQFEKNELAEVARLLRVSASEGRSVEFGAGAERWTIARSDDDTFTAEVHSRGVTTNIPERELVIVGEAIEEYLEEAPSMAFDHSLEARGASVSPEHLVDVVIESL